MANDEIKDDSGPMYPNVTMETRECIASGEWTQMQVQWPGLTVRQWFAGMALQGLLSNKDYLPHIGKKYADQDATAIIAEQAFEMANAMLKESSGK